MTGPRGSAPRRGVALIAVLWFTVALSSITFGALLVAREFVRTAANSEGIIRARWAAEGCAVRLLFQLDRSLTSLQAGHTRAMATAARALEPVREPDCEAILVPTGLEVPVGGTHLGPLRRTLELEGWGPAAADSMVAALQDWVDGDTLTRIAGAEGPWYQQQKRLSPSEGPLADVNELRFVRGFEHADRILHQLAPDSFRIALAYAPGRVLMSLPAFDEEVVRAVVTLRDSGRLVDLRSVQTLLGPEARHRYDEALPALREVAVVDPEAWRIQARGAWSTGPVVHVAFVIPGASARPAVQSTRIWIQ